MIRYHIGAIKYYDSHKNMRGVIQYKSFPDRAYGKVRFTSESLTGDYIPKRGDVVFFGKQNGAVEVLGLNQAIHERIDFPWREILNYIGEDACIDIENTDGKTGEVTFRKSVKVLGEWLEDLSYTDIKALLKSVCDVLENADEDLISDLLAAGIKELFLFQCLSEHYVSLLDDDNLFVFGAILQYVYDESLRSLDFHSISGIFEKCVGLGDEYYRSLIKCCNELFVRAPQELVSRIRDLECFHEVVSNKNSRIDFRLEVYLARAIASDDYSFVPKLPPLSDEQLKTWLLTLNEEEYQSLSVYFPKADDGFKKVYFELAQDDLDTMLPLYKYLSDEDKRSFLIQLSGESHHASEFFSKHGGETIISALSSDPFFRSHPELKIPSDRITDGYAQNYIDLLDAGIINDLSDSNIKACVSKGVSANAQLSILSTLKLEQERINEFLIKEMPDSELAKSFSRRIIENRVRSFDYAVFDIEATFDKQKGHYQVQQAAFVSETERITEEADTLGVFFSKLSAHRIIVGHNIKAWDIGRVLNDKELSFNEEHFIWDTLEIEMVLNPFSKGYSLDNPDSERHTALSDSLFTQKLFWSQMIRLASKQYEWFWSYFPVEVEPVFEFIRSGVHPSLFEGKVGKQSFFKEYGKISKTLSLDLSRVNEFSSAIVIAPKSLWRLIREHSDVLFADDSVFYKRLDREKLSSIPLTDIGSAILRAISFSSRKDILVCDIAPAVRQHISEILTQFYITERPELKKICCTSFGFDSLDKRRKEVADAIFIVGKDIEARENSNVRIGSEEIKLDHSQLTSREGLSLIKRFAESNAPNRIGHDTFRTITGRSLPSDYGNIWVEVLSDEKYCIKYNRDFTKYAEEISNTYRGKVHTIALPWHLCHEPIVIIRSGQRVLGENSEAVQRLSSTAKLRCSYWTYQLSLITSMERSLPIVWVVEKADEIEGLRNAARALGFYVPSSEQIQRSIELANECDHPESSLIIIGVRDFRKLIDAEIHEPYCLVYNCIDIESKSIRWGNMLPFGDEPVKITGALTPKDYVYASWPQLEVFNHLIHDNNPDCMFYMLDPVFDCCDLNYSKLGAETITVDPTTSYHECEEQLSKSFSDPSPRSIKIDVKQAMDEMLEMFKTINPLVKDWKDEQKRILPDIIKKEHNCLICMPTGGGKSILFQLPALYRAKRTGKMSIVISPLKALLKDQVIDLDMPGVDYLNSDKTTDEVERIYQQVRGGEIHLLYMTPERFRSQAFMNALGYRLKKDNGLEYIIFDEAHCISQWGLDFRPDYRFAASESQKICDIFKDTRIELFTATVTKNVRDDISFIIDLPAEDSNNHVRYNPIRDHIDILFIHVDDDPNAKGSKDDTLTPRERKRVGLLYNEIVKSDFDPERSSMLIFSSTRRQVEEFKTELAKMFAASSDERIQQLADRIESFHGGMTTDERDDIYRKFKGEDSQREYSILVATKAFGMGMNIPDIHYIYHAFPSDNLEDFLQEIGRAGRDNTLLPKGYGSRREPDTKPLPTICFVSDQDARESKDLQVRSSLKWDEVRQIYDAVAAYVSQFSKDYSVYVSVPSNIWKRDTNYGPKDDPTAFKIGLHWLSEAKRVETRFLTSAAYDLIIGSNFSSSRWPELEPIQNFIRSINVPIIANHRIQIKIAELRKYCQVRQWELDDLLLECHKRSVVQLANQVSFAFSNRYKKNSLMNRILANKQPEDCTLPFAVCESLLTIQNSGTILSDSIRKSCIAKELESSEFSEKNNKRKSLARRNAERKNEISRIDSVAFRIIGLLPSIKSIKKDEKSESWIIESLTDNAIVELNTLSDDAFKLLHYLTEISYEADKYQDGNFEVRQKNALPSFVWAEAAYKLGMDSFLTIHDAAEVIKYLGLATIDSFLPTGTEVKLTGNRKPLIPDMLDKETVIHHPDAEVYTRFREIDDIRQLKLVNLMTLSKTKAKDPDSLWTRYDEAIKDYFECADRNDFLEWNKKFINEQWLTASDEQIVDEMISQFQGEAITEELAKLNPGQTDVCNYDKDKDLVVLAGPGSGKTHVLTLRCAKLLHSDKVSREDILILAYNRGVVNELKTRLRDLFMRLGYTRMMSRIKVFTFHSFVKTIDSLIREHRANAKHTDFFEESGFIGDLTQDWEKDFASFLQKPENVDELVKALDAKHFRALYIMIDEFQDITQERLDVLFALRRILPKIPGRREARFFVIGDINQSIYGYQRKIKDEDGNYLWHDKDGKELSISPKPLYDSLRKQLGIRKQDDLSMVINYRSYQKILDKAKTVLCSCSSYEPVEIKSDPEMEQRDDCVFEYDAANASWDADFLDIMSDIKDRGLKQVAFLFRTNADLFDAYTKLRGILEECPGLKKQLRVRIQGNSEPFFRTRECYYAIYYLREKDPDEIVSDMGFKEFLDYIAGEKHFTGDDGIEYLDKDAIDLTYAIALASFDSFQMNPKYGELADEMMDIAYDRASELLKIKDHYKDLIPDLEVQLEDEIEVVFSVMHRVKGLEFDAVIINPSENKIGYEKRTTKPWKKTEVIIPAHALRDVLDEERRLLYVSITRAKKYLRIYYGEREQALLTGVNKAYTPATNDVNYARVDSGIENYNKSFGLENEFPKSIKKNSEVVLRKRIYISRSKTHVFNEIYLGNTKIGQVYAKAITSSQEWKMLSNLYINDVYVWRYEDVCNDDQKHTERHNADKWPANKRRPYDYVLVPDISGMGLIDMDD